MCFKKLPLLAMVVRAIFFPQKQPNIITVSPAYKKSHRLTYFLISRWGAYLGSFFNYGCRRSPLQYWQHCSRAGQEQVLGSRYLKDYFLSSWFLLELSAQNLVLDLKYTKWTWLLSLSYTNLANTLILLSKPSVFFQYYQRNNVYFCSFYWRIVKK